MKYVTADAIEQASRNGASLMDLDGKEITVAGWYDFMARKDASGNYYGDGARFVIDNATRRIIAIELIISDQKFGDNDLSIGRVTDPGVPVFIEIPAPIEPPSNTPAPSEPYTDTLPKRGYGDVIPTPGYSVGLSEVHNATFSEKPGVSEMQWGFYSPSQPQSNYTIGEETFIRLHASSTFVSSVDVLDAESGSRINVEAGFNRTYDSEATAAIRNENGVSKLADSRDGSVFGDLSDISAKITNTDLMLVEYDVFGDGRDFEIKLHHKKDVAFRVVSVLQTNGNPLPSWVKFNLDGKTFSGRLPGNVTSMSLEVIISDASGRSKLPITIATEGHGKALWRDGGQSLLRLGRDWRGEAVKTSAPTGLAPFSRQLRAALIAADRNSAH